MIVGVSFLTGLASSNDSVAKRALFLTCQQRVCHIILLAFLTRSSLSLLFSVLPPCVVTFRVMLVSLCDLGRTPAPFSSSLSVLNPSVVSDGCCISGLLYGDRGVNNAISSAAGDHSSSSSDHEEEDEEDEEAGLLSLFHSSSHLPFSLPPSQISVFFHPYTSHWKWLTHTNVHTFCCL